MDLSKLLTILTRPGLARIALTRRIAAGVEHFAVIDYTAADLLIDVGANKGQFSLAFRARRPAAAIVAFEPIPSEADRFEDIFRSDPRVSLHRVALSDTRTRTQFHVTDRKDSSSLLPAGEHQTAIFGVRHAETIDVDVHRLDDYVDATALPDRTLLKLDVQGAELNVLHGCQAIDRFRFIYLEVSFLPLYDGQSLFGEIYAHLVANGFELIGLFNQVFRADIGPVQADALFQRKA